MKGRDKGRYRLYVGILNLLATIGTMGLVLWKL